ncbi:MAG: polysaccharide pyruvyl transferase family protein [Lachnospiraceae bacterium]|nr:polysaccharide pyruvyl transferase family protein [Lachnospiraceae bacterium]
MIVFYGHGGSDNHGCEAIIRGTAVNLQEKFLLYSGNKRADERYGISSLCSIRSDSCKRYERPAGWLVNQAKSRLFGKNPVFQLVDGREPGVYLSVGGDNYCYPGLLEPMIDANRRIRSNKNRTVLWGASIEREALDREDVREDIRQYDLIFARERLTYQLLLDHGIKDNVYLFPDPAFAMKPAETTVDERLLREETIGINISPLIMKYGAGGDVIRQGYLKMIDYILEHTRCSIAMIPHVVKRNNHDLDMIRGLIRERPSERIFVIGDRPADELKYCISKCSFFVGARTHATIAAYSMCVPALVVGYSVKAKGIARELFGSEEGYVTDVRSLRNPEQLLDDFLALYQRREHVRRHLEECMPEYRKKTAAAADILKKHMKKWERGAE